MTFIIQHIGIFLKRIESESFYCRHFLNLIQNYRNVLNKGPEKLTQINVYCDYSLQKTVLLTFKIAWPCMIKIQQAAVIFNKGKANEVRALYGLDLHIQKGEFVVVVGANGSGKSTLLNVIA